MDIAMPSVSESPAHVPDPGAASAGATEAVDALNARAWRLRLSDAAEGLRVAERARVAAQAAGYLCGEAYALRNAGACRCMMQDDDAALADLEVAGRGFDAWKDLAGRASTLNWIGGIHRRRGEFSQAVQAQVEALRLQRAAGDRGGEGDSLNNLGSIYFQTGDMARALEHFHAALTIKEEVGDELGMSDAVNNLGIIHGERGDVAPALDLHTRALELKRRIGDVPGQAIALINVGTTHRKQGDYSRSLGCFEEALGLTRMIGHRFIEAAVLQAMGETRHALGEPMIALELFRESVEVARATGALYPEADALISIGEVLAALGRPGEAIEELTRALETAERIEAMRLVFGAHLALAQAHEAAGDAAAALLHFREYHRVEGSVFSAESERRIQAVIAHAEVEASHREAELLRGRNDELTAANEEKARLLEVLRVQAAELDRLSREDALTGLFNRRHLDAALALEWERARRFGRDLAVVIVDLDHFKAVNDRFSHAVGDEVLRVAGRLLREGTRAVDVAGRWGGEEFVLLLVETPPERAAHLCEKLRAAIEAHDWAAVAPGLRVTASMGAAGNRASPDPAALLAAADARLYEAKRAGRNRVVAE